MKTKTKHLCITHRNLNPTLRVDAAGQTLCNVNTYDYLGFCIDKKLSMNAHIDKLVKKVSYKLHTLSLMRRYIMVDDIAVSKRNICLLLVNGQIKFLKINTKINNLPTVF